MLVHRQKHNCVCSVSLNVLLSLALEQRCCRECPLSFVIATYLAGHAATQIIWIRRPHLFRICHAGRGTHVVQAQTLNSPSSTTSTARTQMIANSSLQKERRLKTSIPNKPAALETDSADHQLTEMQQDPGRTIHRS